jgi:SpoVK/Ycf46/Vps4 family AAA+-type ATPase
MIGFLANFLLLALTIILFMASFENAWASKFISIILKDRLLQFFTASICGTVIIKNMTNVFKITDLEGKICSLETQKTNQITLTAEEKSKIGASIEVAQKSASSSEPLADVIGLESVKQEVQRLRHFILTQKKREAFGLPKQKINLHLVFTGNPGTGKTMIAREIAKIYKAYGLLSKGHLIETDRSGLVSEYIGNTAPKTKEIINEAIGGVLFIDEAYALLDGDGGGISFGKEAIDTLLKEMEDKRDSFVVVVAGYGKEMEAFINSNPGLQSRFSKTIAFPDYTAEELLQLFELFAKKSAYILSDEARDRLATWFITEAPIGKKGFGNGRFVRNLFEKTIVVQSQRVALSNLENKTELQTISLDDVLSGIKNI